MTPFQEQAVKDALKPIDWGKILKWGTVTVQVREGKATLISVEETIKLDTK